MVGLVLVSYAGAVLLIPCLFVGWLAVFRAARKWTATIMTNNQDLARQARELAHLNRTLDEKVAERTRALEASRTAALNMMADAEEARIQVEQANEALARAHEELSKSHNQTHQLLASISSILIGVDEHGRITQWNAAAEETFGMASAQAVGRPFSECGIKWDQAEIEQSIAACLAQGRPLHLDDAPFKRPDGTNGFLGVNVSPINGDNGQGSGFLLLGRDITKRLALEQQLVQAQKLEAIGQLAAGIAHEINTPTQYVSDNTHFAQDAFADLCRLIKKYEELLAAAKSAEVAPELVAEVEAVAEDADIEYLLEEIPKATKQSLEGLDRVARIVRAMKEFSHPGADEKALTDINKAIQSTVTVCRNEWKYVAEMQTDLAADLPLVPCLPGGFNQVILNLVINAAHAIANVVGDGSKGKGTITVSTRHDGDWAEVRISDTGCGIPEDIRSRVFEPFFTTKPVGKGTGQGLAIAHNVVVDKHHGTITFDTETGKGTTFVIRLPARDDGAGGDENPGDQADHASPEGGRSHV